jgi:hypothetical protein
MNGEPGAALEAARAMPGAPLHVPAPRCLLLHWTSHLTGRLKVHLSAIALTFSLLRTCAYARGHAIHAQDACHLIASKKRAMARWGRGDPPQEPCQVGGEGVRLRKIFHLGHVCNPVQSPAPQNPVQARWNLLSSAPPKGLDSS